MHRFFIPGGHFGETYKVTHKDTLFHQISRVFRAKRGDKIVFFKECSNDIVYEIADIKKQEISLVKKETIEKQPRTGKKIILVQAYPNKLATLELLIQKIVEVGIVDIVLFHSEHSQMNSIPENKKQRLSLIAQEAMEQSGGNLPLSILEEKGIKEIFQKYKKQRHIIADPLGSKDYKTGDNDIVLWIGPEGGWSERERLLFKEYNFQSWKFSEKILRLETAAIVGTGILLYGTNPL